MKKNKFIDKCKSWLLTLGVASVFGLAALGVNAAKSYEKASAYQYQNNGDYVFNDGSDLRLLKDFVLNNGYYYDSSYQYDIRFDYSDGLLVSGYFNKLSFEDSYLSFSNTSLDTYVSYFVDTEIYLESQNIDAQSSLVFIIKPSYEGYVPLYDYVHRYEYQHSADLIFNLTEGSSNGTYDFNMLYYYGLSGTYYSSDGFYYRSIELDVFYDSNTTYIVSENLDSGKYLTFLFGTLSDVGVRDSITFLYSEEDNFWEVDDNFITDYTWSDFAYCLPSYNGYQELRNYVLSYNAPQQSGNFISALTSFISLLGGAIVQLATPVASGVTQFASALFIDNSHLSIMGGIIGIFCGIALAVGITSKVYAWVSTLGN